MLPLGLADVISCCVMSSFIVLLCRQINLNLSIGPGADPGVQLAVRLQVIRPYTSGGRLPLLSAWPAVTSIACTRWRHPYMVAHPIPAY